jgi:hypothetical protein
MDGLELAAQTDAGSLMFGLPHRPIMASFPRRAPFSLCLMSQGHIQLDETTFQPGDVMSIANTRTAPHSDNPSRLRVRGGGCHELAKAETLFFLYAA